MFEKHKMYRHLIAKQYAEINPPPPLIRIEKSHCENENQNESNPNGNWNICSNHGSTRCRTNVEDGVPVHLIGASEISSEQNNVSQNLKFTTFNGNSCFNVDPPSWKKLEISLHSGSHAIRKDYYSFLSNAYTTELISIEAEPDKTLKTDKRPFTITTRPFTIREGTGSKYSEKSVSKVCEANQERAFRRSVKTRTVFEEHQLVIMKYHFMNINKSPGTAEIDALSLLTRLDKRVLRVSFGTKHY